MSPTLMRDTCANTALDLEIDWNRTDESAIKEAKARKSNFRLSVDGALRGSGKASGGVALFAYYPSGRRELLFRAGVGFGQLQSAFLAAMLAIEWELQEFVILMNKVSL